MVEGAPKSASYYFEIFSKLNKDFLCPDLHHEETYESRFETSDDTYELRFEDEELEGSLEISRVGTEEIGRSVVERLGKGEALVIGVHAYLTEELPQTTVRLEVPPNFARGMGSLKVDDSKFLDADAQSLVRALSEDEELVELLFREDGNKTLCYVLTGDEAVRVLVPDFDYERGYFDHAEIQEMQPQDFRFLERIALTAHLPAKR